MKGSFHGRTSLAVAATDNPNIVAPVNQTDNVIFVPLNDEQALEEAFLANKGEISFGDFGGHSGCGRYSRGEPFVPVENPFAVRPARCRVHRRQRAVRLRPERTVLFARLAGVSADIYSMAKGIGNGFPMGAISISPRIAPKYGMLGTTFGGNHLACAAAIAVADVIEQENLIDQCEKDGRLPDRRVAQASQY